LKATSKMAEKKKESKGGVKEQHKEFQEFITSLKMSFDSPEMIKEQPVFILDFDKLIKFNPFLAEKFLDDYNWISGSFNDFLKSDRGFFGAIEPINLPDSSYVELDKISTKMMDKLFKTRAVVEFRPDGKSTIILSSKFECPSCGAVLSVKQVEEAHREPSRCTCGWKGNFKLLSNEISDFLEIIIRHRSLTKEGVRVYVKLEGKKQIDYFNTSLGNGKLIDIVGSLKIKNRYIRNKRTNEGTMYIESFSIKAPNEEIYSINPTPEELIQIQEIAEDVERNGIKAIVHSIFPSTISEDIIGQQVLLEGIALQMVAGRNTFIDGVKYRKKPHIFAVGDPGTDKSNKIARAQLVDPRIKSVSGASSTTAGVLLGMSEFEGRRYISGGAISQADNGILFIDELPKFEKEARGSLHDPLASQVLKYDKVGHNIHDHIDVAMTFFGNPINDRFTDQPIYKQILDPRDQFGKIDPNSAFLSRCDLVIGIKDIVNAERDKKISKAILLKKTKVKPKYSVELLRNYILYAKDKINPKLSGEAIKYISDYVALLRNYIQGYPLTHRLNEAFGIFSECFAKLRFSKKIEIIDVQRTFDLIVRSLISLDLHIANVIEEEIKEIAGDGK